MKINEWFDNGCDYGTGVVLYMQQKGHSRNLVSLFMKKETPNNLDKLKYELGKYRSAVAAPENLPIQNIIISPKVNPQVNIIPVKPKIESAHVHFFYRLNQLAIELHPMAMKQRDDFQKAISLKLQLNQLHEMEEGKALEICIEIENLFDAIDMAQKVLKHYVKHKVVLDIENRDFSHMTPDQRHIRLKNKRSSIVKLERRITTYKQELANELPISRKTKLQVQLQKSTANLLKQEFEVQELMDYINGKS